MRYLLPLLAGLVLAAPASAAGRQSCVERIAFVRQVIDKDFKTGFIGKVVYARMLAEIEAARSVCLSGRDAQAQLLISAAQSRHGYPVR